MDLPAAASRGLPLHSLKTLRADAAGGDAGAADGRVHLVLNGSCSWGEAILQLLYGSCVCGPDGDRDGHLLQFLFVLLHL